MTAEEKNLLEKASTYIERFAKEGCDKSIEWLDNYKKIKND
jgi:hypothetical protein